MSHLYPPYAPWPWQSCARTYVIPPQERKKMPNHVDPNELREVQMVLGFLNEICATHVDFEVALTDGSGESLGTLKLDPNSDDVSYIWELPS